jgi:RNA polymerase sigma-70 factor (ECF subfamily)
MIPLIRYNTAGEPIQEKEGMNQLRRELEQMYDECSQQLFTCALAITRRKELAEDAMQNAFCKLITLKERPQTLKLYVFRSVRNAAIDILRKEKRMNAFSEDYIYPTRSTPRDHSETSEFQQRVVQAMQQLSDDERETVVHHLYADLTFREISELREISINTVMSWYRRGIEKLRIELEEVQ